MARVTLRSVVAGSISKAAEYQKPRSGKGEVARSKELLDSIQTHLGRVFPAPERNIWATNVLALEQDDVSGDEVVAQKTRDGVFVVSRDGFILSHDVSMARTWTRGFKPKGFIPEPIVVLVKDMKFVGIRISDGSQTIAFAFRPIPGADPAKRRALRDAFIMNINIIN
jgi:hypothetical protein